MSRGRIRAAAPVRVVFDGQSMNVSPNYPNNAPNFAMKGKKVPWANVAVGGKGWGDLMVDINTRLRPQVRNQAGCVDILVMNGGQGDMLNEPPSGGQDGVVCYQRAIDYGAAARALGFDYIILVTWSAMGPNMLGTGRPNPVEQQTINDYNALALANSGGFDGVVNVSVAPFDDASELTYFMFDRLHLSPAGAEIYGERLWVGIQELIEGLP